MFCWAYFWRGLLLGSNFAFSKWVGLVNKTSSTNMSIGLYLGGLIIGRIFASEIWGAYFWECLFFFFFLGGGGGLISRILRYVIAAMLVDINKRFLQNYFCLFHQHDCHAFFNWISGDWLQTINIALISLPLRPHVPLRHWEDDDDESPMHT